MAEKKPAKKAAAKKPAAKKAAPKLTDLQAKGTADAKGGRKTQKPGCGQVCCD